jgi:hypothetical protein
VSAADEATGRYCVRAPPEGRLVPGTIKAWIVTGAHAIFGHWIPDQAVRRNIWRIMERTEKQKRQSASHGRVRPAHEDEACMIDELLVLVAGNLG